MFESLVSKSIACAVLGVGAHAQEARQAPFEIPPSGEPDLHSTPVIAADGRGILHVLTGAHTQPFYYLRSLAPDTVAGGWTKPRPEDFPEDLPVYKKAEILNVLTRSKDEFSISMQTGDALDKVSAFYKEALESGGWVSETAMELPNRTILSCNKGNRVVSLMIVKDKDGGTVISVTAGLDI